MHIDKIDDILENILDSIFELLVKDNLKKYSIENINLLVNNILLKYDKVFFIKNELENIGDIIIKLLNKYVYIYIYSYSKKF